jgi:hypothetical protein
VVYYYFFINLSSFWTYFLYDTVQELVKIMSHRLEKNADTKNIDYKEPKTSRSYSTSESDADRERKKQTNAEGQTQDTEAIWDLTRESGTDNASIGNRGSFADEENASVDNIVEGIEKGSNKRRISDIEG